MKPGPGAMLRVGALIAAIALLVGLGVVGLLAHSLHRAQVEERLRHQIVAERVFDELERELTDLTLREEGRSFLEYRYFYVPAGQLPGLAGLERSPLAGLPRDPAVVGWFQQEPDGSLQSPMRPRAGEQQLARDNLENADDPALLAREAELLGLLAGATLAASAAPAAPAREPPAEPSPVTSKVSSMMNTLDRGIRSRSGREVQSVQSWQQSLATYQNEEVDVQQLLPVQAPALTQERADVQLSPLAGQRLGAGHLVLSRSVRIGGETRHQGLVLELAALEEDLQERVLGGTELEPWVSLTWDGPAPARRYAFTHRFAAPFQDLSATAALGRIPGQAPAGTGAVLVLSALLLALCGLGGVVLYRMVAVRLEYAARRGDFVAAVSHELKTPLTSIRMMAEILRDGMVPDEDRRQQYYQIITAEAERLSRLIGNVLTLARLERGTPLPERVVGDAGEVLRQAVEVLGPHARELGFTLEVWVAPDLPSARMDRDALLQVLVNLLDNALKFSAEAEIKRVVIEARPGSGGVLLRVRDHGPGVPPRQLRRIFEPFFRGERELTRRTRGTGIGLALVRGLVIRMGGRIQARNHPEGGLEVTVALAGT
ncbi:MAG: HAMP domain-containing sensor histidine kinase [Pseudomonadota bacterium]